MRARGLGACARPVTSLLLVCLALFMFGCEKDELKASERKEIDKVIRTGVNFSSDPYVRAETLRVLELLADPSLDQLALSSLELDGESPMVKVIALRVLLATKNAEGERLALSLYSQLDEAGKFAVLEASQEYGPDTLKSQLYDRALRSKNLQLRKIAFSRGILEEVRAAVKEKKELELKSKLLPRLSKFVAGDDFYLASASLKKLVEIGQGERAEPLIRKLSNEQAPMDERLKAGKILWFAQVEAAKPIFDGILAEDLKRKEADEDILGLPVEQLDKKLIRMAVLGSVALGENTSIERAQGYLSNASVDESLEVLESLARNLSKDSTVTLKVAMKDARKPVRQLAVELYGSRADADPRALINAMRTDDPLVRRNIANVLAARFPGEWTTDLRLQLRAEERKDLTLSLLRDVLDSQTSKAVLEPIQEDLIALTKEKTDGADKKKAKLLTERAAMAAYLLLLSDPGNVEYATMLEQQSNVQTKYIFLEHLVRHRPKESTQVFRAYFYDDLFTMRLMSAAGLWQAYRTSPTQGAKGAAPAAEGAPAAEKEEPDAEAE